MMTLRKETIELIEKKVEARYNSQMDLGGYMQAITLLKDVLSDESILASVKGEEWVRVEDSKVVKIDGCENCKHNIPGLEEGLYCINNCIKGSHFEARINIEYLRQQPTPPKTNNQ